MLGAAVTLHDRGGRTLPDMAYKIFYYGSAWNQDPGFSTTNPHVEARKKIDNAIKHAMDGDNLNQVLSQYFPGKSLTTKAHDSEIIDNYLRGLGPQIAFNEHDVRGFIKHLHATGKLANLDLAITAVNIVLPQGMSLEILGLDERERPAAMAVEPGVPRDRPDFSSGIAGYHGSVVLTDGTEVLYSVVAWSDGNTGIPVPGWDAWESVVAILYHELQEIRTNPDVDKAVRSGKKSFVGFNTDPLLGPDDEDCREIADLPLIFCGTKRHLAFKRVTATTNGHSTSEVPIQIMWSNSHSRSMP